MKWLNLLATLTDFQQFKQLMLEKKQEMDEQQNTTQRGARTAAGATTALSTTGNRGSASASRGQSSLTDFGLTITSMNKGRK